MVELMRLAGTKSCFKTKTLKFSLISACLLLLKKSFIRLRSFHLKTKKACKNSESYLKFREYTSLTKPHLKQTPCSSLMVILIIRRICLLLNGKFPSTAAKQPKLFCEA